MRQASAEFLIADRVPVGTGTMPGRARETVKVDWVVPEAGQWVVYARLDPENKVNETTKSNNETPETWVPVGGPSGNAAQDWEPYR